MTDNMENATTGAGGQGTPIPAASSGAASPSAVDYAALAEALKPVIAQEVERATQSTKDKRFAKVLDKQDNFESQLADLRDLMAGGMSEKAALRVMKATRNVESEDEQAAAQAVPTGTRQAAPRVDHSVLLSSMGLDANDPEVIQALREGGDEVSLISKYVAIAQTKKQKAAPTPAAGQQMPVPSSVVPATRNILDVERDLEIVRHQPGFAGTKKYRDLVAEHTELVKAMTG